MIIHEVEQGTQEWKCLRASIPTTSEWSKIVSGTGKLSESMIDYARKLGREMYTGEPTNSFQGNAHTRRGNELEPEAADEYEFKTGSELIIVGFVTNDDKTLGSSPDRLVIDKNGGKGCLEIKCLSDEEHHKLIDYYSKNKDIPPKYKPQLQGEMFVCDREWNDIYFYHPFLPSITHRVTPDNDYLSLISNQLVKLFKERQKVFNSLKQFKSKSFSTEKNNHPKEEKKLSMDI